MLGTFVTEGLEHQPPGLLIFYREMRRVRSITRQYTRTQHPLHGALSAAYDGWWSADKFTALLPVCPERVREGRRPVYLRVQTLFIIYTCGRSLPFVRVPRAIPGGRGGSVSSCQLDNYAISSFSAFCLETVTRRLNVVMLGCHERFVDFSNAILRLMT